MTDITDLMNIYRECVRNLWNTYFRMPNPSRSEVDAAFRFDHIKELLFSEMVLRKIGKTDVEKNRDEPWPFLRVLLSSSECPALINRSAEKHSGYWDYPVNRLEAATELYFIDYFDWEEFDFIDLRYYRVKIMASANHSHLVGREALIETHYGSVIVS